MTLYNSRVLLDLQSPPVLRSHDSSGGAFANSIDLKIQKNILKILHIVSELLWESKRVLRYCHSSWIPLSVLTFSNYFQSDDNPCHC